ncbi:MAG: ABC transporter permease [Capsulimonadaceae bacterium]
MSPNPGANRSAFRPVSSATHLKPRRDHLAIGGSLTPAVDIAIGLTGIGVLIAVWCGLTYGGIVKPIFLPTPSGIVADMVSFYHRGMLVPAIENSVLRVLVSLLLVLVVGIPIGALMGAFAAFDALLRKIVNGCMSIPTPCLMGLIVLWFGIEERAKVVFLFLAAIFYMIALVKNAVLSVREDYLLVASDLGATPWQTIRGVLIPAALPQIWDAVAVCNGIMWTYIVLAEFINGSEAQIGLGYLMQIGSRTQQSGAVYGTLIIVAAISSFTTWVLRTIRMRYLNW